MTEEDLKILVEEAAPVSEADWAKLLEFAKRAQKDKEKDDDGEADA